MLLNVQQVSKSFPGDGGPAIDGALDGVPVLNGLSLSLDAGEVVALTGESGSGKSTLLHIIAGLEPVDRGKVTFDGTEITTLNDPRRAAFRRSDIGIVFQQFNLIPSLTVGQNLSFQARLAGRMDYTRVDALAEALGLQDQLTKFPEDLSGGQQQRVAIGRAIAADPRLLLADEPTGNLDEANSDTVFELLVQLARDNATGLLIATHSTRLAERTDRRLHLSRGSIA